MGALPAVDQHGFAAFRCAVDQSELQPVPDEPSVLRCPHCGHRTDEPGEGVLADGFDIVHRQWGLRGDPHLWHALRDRVGAVPTPATREDVRAAFVGAIRDVIDVDIDTFGEPHVVRRELDHGGMSGGMVDIGWWRTKGVPLLVDRAVDRRPVPPTPTKRSIKDLAMTVVVWAILLAIPAALVGGGGWLLYQRAVGTRVEATVLSCDSSGHFRRFGSTFRTECVAEWTIDGETVVGNFEAGNGASDVGKTVNATVRGDTAYSRSLVLPIVLIVLGAPFLIPVFVAIRGRIRSGDTAEAVPASEDEGHERAAL